MLAGHVKHQRYEFTPPEADALIAEYRDERGQRAVPPARRLRGRGPRNGTARVSSVDASSDPGHRVTIPWMDATVTTLEDLLRERLFAVVVGVNPAPPSVAAGHYWQGKTGRTLWRRLRAVGLLPDDFEGYEDDAAFAAGVGFTDVVKRPTASASELSPAELEHGLADLEAKLAEVGAPLVIFAFKKAATTLLGDFEGKGFVSGLRVGASDVFVMLGPYERTETAEATLDELRQRVTELRRDDA
jgi:TDG/mug DNA glycosylase family protein